MLSHVQLFVTPSPLAHQASLSLDFSRKEYWSRLPFPTSEDLPDPGNRPVGSLESPTLTGGFTTPQSQPLLNKSLFISLLIPHHY